jgi:hypothetical protein
MFTLVLTERSIRPTRPGSQTILLGFVVDRLWSCSPITCRLDGIRALRSEVLNRVDVPVGKSKGVVHWAIFLRLLHWATVTCDWLKRPAKFSFYWQNRWIISVLSIVGTKTSPKNQVLSRIFYRKATCLVTMRIIGSPSELWQVYYHSGLDQVIAAAISPDLGEGGFEYGTLILG